MRFVLDTRYRFRGWQKARAGLFDCAFKRATFLSREEYQLLLQCDGAHDLDLDELSYEQRDFLEKQLEKGIVRPAARAEYLLPEQEYTVYPAEYKEEVQWSITGACNLKCRHCFMSAPHAKHGAPTHEQIVRIADQLSECGVFRVGLTGGEPLVRDDLLEIIDALREREIGVSTIYTNGWLLDETFLDELDMRRMHPNFQLSYDGVGWHDFLRGVPGAEERTIEALKLLQAREYNVSIGMCLHRKSRHVLRESVNLLASLGVRSLKCGAMQEQGEWLSPEVRELQLTPEEELQMFVEYIPKYFEDDAPLSIMMGGAFMYTPGNARWGAFNLKECPVEMEGKVLACGVLLTHFYIGAEGMVCPCMGMADTSYAGSFPNLLEEPLSDILSDSDFTRLCRATVADVRDRNPKCRECEHMPLCGAGCRNAVLIAGEGYFGIDPALCWYFENDGPARIEAAAKAPFEAYLKGNPPKEEREDQTEGLDEQVDISLLECP